MKKMIMIVLAVCFCVGASFSQNATKSIVYLKNGSTVNCEIMEWQNDTIRVKMSDGSSAVYPIAEVERIANASALGEKKTENGMRDYAGYKLRRLGRDICVGSISLDPVQIYNVLDKDLYDTYVSAYQQSGWGAFFITAGLVSAGLGLYLGILGKNQNIRNSGWVLCGVSGVLAPIGYVVRGIAKGRIGWVVDEYNNRKIANTLELAPTVLGFNDILTDNKTYAVGATLSINF